MPIFKKKTEAPKPEVKAPATEAQEVTGCQAPVDGKPCGKPLAVGQSAVCTNHVRTN